MRTLLEFPCSALLAVCILLVVYAIYRYAGDSKVVRGLSNPKTACFLLAVGAIMLAVEGTFSWQLHTTPVFVAYVMILMLTLSFVVQKTLKETKTRSFRYVGFLLNHLGLFVILWASLFGSPDVTKAKMMILRGGTANVAYTEDMLAVPLPFDVTLEDFHVELYNDGRSPKQFISSLLIDGTRMETSVNSPCSYEGYTIYQDGYDAKNGRYSVIQLVRDPWLPMVYLGMGLLAVGSVLLLFGRWNAKFTVPIALGLTVVFTLVTIAKINMGTMMPALRSWWFVPHLFIYMVAYSLMAMAVVIKVVNFQRKTKTSKSDSKFHEVSTNLMRSATALLIIGMLTGSIWAKEVWGDYWACDPKENWAAVTWFVSLIYLHVGNKHSRKALSVMILAFVALQITWYGVNYLPSASVSLHSYYSK